MRKKRLMAIILICSLTLSFLPQSEVGATEIMTETEDEEENLQPDSSSAADETQSPEESDETEVVILQDPDSAEADGENDAIEIENDTSEEYQEESSVQNATAGNYTYSVSSGEITITKYSGT